MSENLINIIESLVFASETPLTAERLKTILPENSLQEINSALKKLKNQYDEKKGGFYLYEIAGGFQFRTRPEYAHWIRVMKQAPKSRLGRATLETLAIIAYRQPVIKSDIEHIRGVDSGSAVKTLLEKKLIRIVGRKDIPGRPLVYATSKHFLEVFGLKCLNDLPALKDISDPSEFTPVQQNNSNDSED